MAGMGDITTEYTVWCGTCAQWHQLSMHSGKADAIRIWRKMGWKRTSKKWSCPKCAEKLKKL